MSTSSGSAFNFPSAVVLRWALKAFLAGWFLGVAAAINAFVNR